MSDCILVGMHGIHQTANLDLGSYLSWLTRRQETVASNIANADTPGYKTQDVEMPGDFSELVAEFSPLPTEVSGLPSRNDGNNVSIDRESRLLAENDIHFNLATQLLKDKIKDIRSAIEEGRS